MRIERPGFPWQRYNKYLLCNYPNLAVFPQALVSVARQRIYIIKRRNLMAVYPVSTSRFGVGNRWGSYRTPKGVHYVAAKIGSDEPLLRCFIHRKASRELAADNPFNTISADDVITTRILWLAGLEAKVNQGGYVDSMRRYIYIHGTIDENRIGIASSSGCIRMRNVDVCEVFAMLVLNSLVYVF